MLLGMPTLVEIPTIDENVELCKKLDLSFVELNMNLPQYQVENIKIDKYKKLMRENDIFFTIHLDENLNIADFNRKVTKAYVDTVLETIELAKAINCPLLNMHMNPGVHFKLPGKKVYLFKEYHEQYLADIRNFKKLCEEKIGDSDICISIENTAGYDDYLQEAIDVLISSEVFKLTYDIGHDYCAGKNDNEFIINRKDKLTHMHIHDANKKTCHLPLGTGEIDINRKFNLAKENNCTVVVEVKTVDGLEESINYIKKSIL